MEVIKYQVEGPLMAISSSDISKFTLVVHPDDKVGECIITGKKEDGVIRGYPVSEDFAPTQDLLYYVVKEKTGSGYTHRLCSTGETLDEELGEAPDFFEAMRRDLWDERRKAEKRQSFAHMSRALHNLRCLFAVRVNGRWAIVGGDGFCGLFLSCGYTREDGEVVENEYGWEFEVEHQPHCICYLDGEITAQEV